MYIRADEEELSELEKISGKFASWSSRLYKICALMLFCGYSKKFLPRREDKKKYLIGEKL